jgi:ribosomal-protein-alanine N-acetyltransferase
MTTGDVSRVVALEREVYPQPWSEGVFRDELSLANRSYLVIEDAGSIVAYGGMLTVDQDAHITTLAVDPEARRNRLGTRLMLALVDEALSAGAEHLTLEVRVTNEAAHRLYERFGFSPVGVRKNYYLTEDALVMWAIDIGSDDYQERISAIRRGLEHVG